MYLILVIIYLLLVFVVVSASIQGPSYAFSAYDLSHAPNPSSGAILIFAKTQINENNVYNTATGKFTAPVDGVYVFHTTLHMHIPKKYLWIEFNAGGHAVGGRFTVIDYRHEDSSSGSAIAKLEKGEEVFIKVTSATGGITFKDDAHRRSSFSGYLLSI